MEKKEKDKFRKETITLLLETREIRSQVLILHLALEQLMNKVIKESFNKPDILFNKSFSHKIDILFSLGVNEVLIEDIRSINKIRNIFAHELFSSKKIPKYLENKIRNHVRDIVERNVDDKGRRNKLLNSEISIMLSGVEQSIIIKLLASI